MTSSLTLYVTANGVDHGPLSLEETAKRVGVGEFKPDDLSWHQGVSGWVPLKQLPEWSQINKTPLASLAPEKDNIEDNSALKNITKRSSPANSKKINPRGSSAKSVISSSQSFEENKDEKAGMGIVGKLMVLVATLVFLSTLGVVGFLVYKNLDRFIPPTDVEEIEQKNVKTSESEPEEKSNLISEPDPFAAPQDE
jgi:hypothetical protein